MRVTDDVLGHLRAFLGHLGGGRRAPIWYTPAYRLPIPSLETISGVEPRRADLVVWYLLERGFARANDFMTPRPADYAALLRVHDPAYLESLTSTDELARIFAVTPGEIVIDEVMRTLRLAVGGTIAAARHVRANGGAAFNLFGGFHHAAPATGGGFCALNDIAIAIAELRSDGLRGRIVVLDLDAHPPDGTAACVAGDAMVTIGSISGSSWGSLPGVVEMCLPGADDVQYLAALKSLLGRMPKPELVFVLCGGDVLLGDKLGALSLTLGGVRERDLAVARWAQGVPSVWLPAGGYSTDAWKVLAGAHLAVTRDSRRRVGERDPLGARFTAIARGLDVERLSGNPSDSDDVELDLLHHAPRKPKLLDYYTAEGIEYALTRFGFYEHLRRLGYRELQVEIDPPDDVGQRAKVTGLAGNERYVLMDAVLARGIADGQPSLVVQWLSLRNPRASFGSKRPLPGQEVPGLGLARDSGQLFGRMAERLRLANVSLRPAWVHSAYAARNHFRFVDPERQARFVELLYDLRDLALVDVARALADGRVRRGGEPYAWESELMVYSPGDPPPDLTPRADHRRFTVSPI